MFHFPFADDFESYPLGSHPDTWTAFGSPWDFPGSDGTAQAGGPLTSTQCASIGKLQATSILGGFASVSHKWDMLFGEGDLTVGAGILNCTLGSGGYVVFQVGMQGDSRLQASVLGPIASHVTTYAGSSLTALHPDVWYTITANVILAFNIFGITAQVNLAINGVQELDVFVQTSELNSALAAMDAWTFNPANIQGMLIDNILVTGPGGTITPVESTEPAKTFQGVMEILQNNPDTEAVVEQGVIELIMSPTPPPFAIASCVMHD